MVLVRILRHNHLRLSATATTADPATKVVLNARSRTNARSGPIFSECYSAGPRFTAEGRRRPAGRVQRAAVEILELARNVSALANTHGGVIVVGAREAKPQIVFGGRDPRVAESFDNLGKRLHPLPELMMHRVNYGGVTVPVIVVKPHPSELVVSDDGAFVREGEANKRMTAAEIQAKLPPQPDPITNEHLSKSISAMSEQIETLRKDLKYAQSLKGQRQVLLVGFVLGILASVIASYIYGH